MLHVLHWCYPWTALLSANRVIFSCILLVLLSYKVTVQALWKRGLSLKYKNKCLLSESVANGYLAHMNLELTYSFLLGVVGRWVHQLGTEWEPSCQSPGAFEERGEIGTAANFNKWTWANTYRIQSGG